jgi:glycosyltransferase involved in cell wall biosynthesis
MLHYDPIVTTGDVATYLDRVPIHRELPRELAALGHEVHLVHLYPTDHQVDHAGVTYHFVASSAALRLAAKAVASTRYGDPAEYELGPRAARVVRDLRPDVVHFHGLTLTWNLLLASRTIPRPTPLVLHYHGGYPPRHPLARRALRVGLQRASRYLFTERSQSQPFVASGLIRDPDRVAELVETSSTFQRHDRRQARRRTRMVGDPVFVWTGRLHPIKDPVTALLGFEHIVAAWPGAQLYLYYLSDGLLPELQALVRARPGLAGHVHFRGRVTSDQMQDIYNSADFFLQASHREFSGCALLEAMACGVIPVVTDIPSFRKITANGRFGVLFTPGDPRALAGAALSQNVGNVEATSREIRQYFEQTISFQAMARQLDQIYQELRDPIHNAASATPAPTTRLAKRA